tara:strand:- start:2270 stop:4915 length:2646 start_codon:yes stop_codon:yes gene_type:complete
MSTLRVDKIKSRTGTTVTIPDSQNLTVTGGLTVSGTQSFAAGATLSLQGTDVNSGTRGDVLYYDATGKIAKLNVGAAGAVLKSDGSDVVWGAIGGAPNVYYVATNGTDAAGRGSSVDTAWKTIKYACSNIGTPTATTPAVIFIKGGVYEETQLPIIIPPYTTITGDSLRTTIIKPASGLDSSGSVLNNRSTLFRCSNGVIVQDLVCDGMGGYTVGSPAYDPTAATMGGIYFQLNQASPITDKSPYIYNVTTFGDGATGALIDGALHNTGHKTMLFHTYTAIHSDGLGIWSKDNGKAEVISGFTYYAQVGLTSTGGSQIRALNSSNSYGEYGVFAKGFDTTETANQGQVVGTMLTYTNVITTPFTNGEQITGGTSGATAYVVNVQSEPKVIYIVGKSGTFQAGEVITGGTSSATATLDSGGSFESNQSGRILVTTFANSAVAGDSLQFSTTDGNAYQIQTVSSVTANNVAYHVIVLSTSRATPVPNGTTIETRKRFSTVRLTGHDFLSVGTGDKTTTNWPNSPTQPASQADQIVTNTTDPGRVYYTATDEKGNFYVGEFFKVDQATGKVTLDSSAFDLKGLESLQLGSIGGLIGASINEFSTDNTLSQNSDAKCPTQAAVKSYVDTISATTPTGGTLAVTGALTVSTNLTVTGNFTVNGTTTTVNSTNTTISDKLIELANGASGSASGDAGIIIERGSDSNVFIGWDEDQDRIRFTTGSFTGASSGSLTHASDAALSVGRLETARLVVNEIIEKADIKGDVLTGTPNINLEDKALQYFTSNASANWTFNFRGGPSTTLDSMMNTNDVMTVTLLTTHGGTAYIPTGTNADAAVKIDGVTTAVQWQGGSAPTGGNDNGIDAYTYSIIKTGSAAFTVIGSQTAYG